MWHATLVPGLLQTPNYRRAIAWSESPDLPTAQLERRIEWQVQRQERLKDPNLQVTAILAEAALCTEVGGKPVITEQLASLVALSDLPNICVRVVPFTATTHLGSITGSFTLLEFPDWRSGLTQPPIVYVEGWTGDLYLERGVEIDSYQSALREIDRVALTSTDSVALIKERMP